MNAPLKAEKEEYTDEEEETDAPDKQSDSPKATPELDIVETEKRNLPTQAVKEPWNLTTRSWIWKITITLRSNCWTNVTMKMRPSTWKSKTKTKTKSLKCSRISA